MSSHKVFPNVCEAFSVIWGRFVRLFVDYLIDDYDNLQALPLEIKSGKDYKVHSALGNFLSAPLYNIHHAIVFSNEREVKEENGITYMPVYYSMFLSKDRQDADGLTLPVLLPPEI